MLNIDYVRLYKLADENCEAFIHNAPFPNACIDNFFSPGDYAKVHAAFPAPDSDIWKKPTNKHVTGKKVTRQGQDGVKELLYSPAAREIFLELNSGLFLRFLEKLTGINGLIGDPHFAEGGFHCSESGGFLDIHADFSHHDHLGLERRLNLLFYLNDEWKEEYGGALGLYDHDLKKVKNYYPFGNRFLIFATSDTSYHGHPEPMKNPSTMFRKSIALYYYSLPTERKISKIVFPEDKGFTFQLTKD